jgi:MFS family permease
VLFGTGIAMLSWVLEVFGEHSMSNWAAWAMLVVSIVLLLGYGVHAGRTPHPLLRLSIFKVRTFRVPVLGGFVTRLGLGGMPFLLPLLFQVGLGLPAWQSGLLMMPAAMAAMGMKLVAAKLLRRFGYRTVLIVNTVLIGITIALFSMVGQGTPLWHIVVLGLAQGFFNSLQFTSMNSMTYADIEGKDSSMASSIGSSMQQLAMSFGLACGSLVTAWYLGAVPQTDGVAVSNALHHAFLTLGLITVLSSASFWTLKPGDGDVVSQRGQ